MSKLHRPGIFPFLEKFLRPACLWSLLVQGTSIANCDLVSPLPFFPVRSCTSWCYNTAWHSSPAGLLTQGAQAPQVVQVQQMMLSWVRFLHYTSRGPPWHPIQAIITWKEWYKRDLSLLVIPNSCSPNPSEWKGFKNKAKHKEDPQTPSKVSMTAMQSWGILQPCQLEQWVWCCWNLFGVHPNLLGQHYWGKADDTFTVIAIRTACRNNTLFHLRSAK